jgi:crotonobetainyl-CoA:carnitine CoA-transferase CaiB-like acyl-CoA transferase
VRRWAAQTDVVVESFWGALEQRGLGVEALRRLNPRLVLLDLGGRTAGPLAGGRASTSGAGRGGLMSITGRGRPPHKAVSPSRTCCTWSAVTGILAGLAARGRDRIRTHVTTDLFSSSLAALVNTRGVGVTTEAGST